MAMSREDKSEFATWVYRGLIGVLLSFTFIIVKSNYDEFQDMKKDVQQDKVNHIVIDSRLTRIESKVGLR
jgi:hypothetical protein